MYSNTPKNSKKRAVSQQDKMRFSSGSSQIVCTWKKEKREQNVCSVKYLSCVYRLKSHSRRKVEQTVVEFEHICFLFLFSLGHFRPFIYRTDEDMKGESEWGGMVIDSI